MTRCILTAAVLLGTAAITVPTGSVAEPMTWAYEELDGALHPLALRTRTSLLRFRLTAFRFRQPAPDIQPTDSFSVVLTFSNTLRSLAEPAAAEPLQLYRWENGHWTKHGISCLAEQAENRVACSVAPQRLGEFVLTQAQHDAYLPMVASARGAGFAITWQEDPSGLRPGKDGYSRGQLLLAIAIAGIYGVLDEVHQRFVPGRMPDALDVLADLIGAVLGVYLLHALVRGSHRG